MAGLLRRQGQFLLYFYGAQCGPFADPGLFALEYVIPGFEVDPGQQMKLTQFAFEVPSSETGTPLQTPVGVVPYVHPGDSLGSLAAVPGIITVNSQGSGPAVALNRDNSPTFRV